MREMHQLSICLLWETITSFVELVSKDVSDYKVVGLGIKHFLDLANEVQKVSSMYLDEV